MTGIYYGKRAVWIRWKVYTIAARWQLQTGRNLQTWYPKLKSLLHTSGISIRTNKKQNIGMQSSLRHIERHKHKHKEHSRSISQEQNKRRNKEKFSLFCIYKSQTINHALFSYRSCAYAYVASVNQAKGRLQNQFWWCCVAPWEMGNGWTGSDEMFLARDTPLFVSLPRHFTNFTILPINVTHWQRCSAHIAILVILVLI